MRHLQRILAVDAVGALHGGAARVAQAAANAALRADVEAAVVFVSGQKGRRFDLPDSERLRIVEVKYDRGSVERLWWLTEGAREACRRVKATHVLFLGGGGLADENAVRGVLIQQSLPFVPDGLARHGFGDRMRFAAIAAIMGWSVAGADVVCVQTETMRSAVRLRFGVDIARIRVTRAGLGGGFERGQSDSKCCRAQAGGIRALYVGNDSPYKNLGVVPKALQELSRRGNVIALTATVKPGALGRVPSETREIGYVEGERLTSEYREAGCLVMPSLAETVCLPLVEAMSVGLPVVVADRPYAREVCEGAAVYFDPLSPEDLARAVLEATSEGPERDRRIAEGHRRAAIWSSPTAYDDLIRAVLDA